MLKKLGSKVLGLLLAVVLLTASVGNVLAAVYISEGSVSQKKLRLWASGTDDGEDFTDGYVLMQIESVTNNVIKVKIGVTTTGLEIENSNGTLTLTSQIIDNFLVTVEGESAMQDSNNPAIINWQLGDVGTNSTKEFFYTLTPKESFNETILSDEFFVADTFVFSHGVGQGSTVVTYQTYKDGAICIPYVKLTSETTVDTPSSSNKTDNPKTAAFTDIAILSVIAVIAGGVLVLTLKNNKFTNI